MSEVSLGYVDWPHPVLVVRSGYCTGKDHEDDEDDTLDSCGFSSETPLVFLIFISTFSPSWPMGHQFIYCKFLKRKPEKLIGGMGHGVIITWRSLIQFLRWEKSIVTRELFFSIFIYIKGWHEQSTISEIDLFAVSLPSGSIGWIRTYRDPKSSPVFYILVIY